MNIRHYRVRIELTIWFIAFSTIFSLAIYFNGHEALDAFFSSYEAYDLDELFTALCIGGALGLLYSVLRVKDLSYEVNRRVIAEKNVDWIACHDPLTDLPNRRFLNAVLARREPGNDSYAVFSIDLDGFKKINDLLGHDVGDQVLKVVAERLKYVFPNENIYRLGGDEFLVLTKRHGNLDLAALAKGIAKHISKPIAVNDIRVDLGASVGVARFPEDSSDLASTIQQADCAMYAAKKAGRNNVSFFVFSMQEVLVKRAKMEADLRCALKKGHIRPYYQPLIDLKTKEVVGFEALARWETNNGSFIPPCEFIPLAEEAGLIVELTDQLLRMACRDALLWPPHTTLAFNLSPLQLTDRLLGLRILAILGEVGLSVHRLELEITESALIQDAETARIVLNSLVDAGIKIALDDFGTGYSSLSQLSSYRFDRIKIDRSFVSTFEHSDKQDKIVRAIIALGNGLGVQITAEGIEEESQLRRLQALGCDVGQGFLLGRPEPMPKAMGKADVSD